MYCILYTSIYIYTCIYIYICNQQLQPAASCVLLMCVIDVCYRCVLSMCVIDVCYWCVLLMCVIDVCVTDMPLYTDVRPLIITFLFLFLRVFIHIVLYLGIDSVPSEGQTIHIWRYIHAVLNCIALYFPIFNKVELCLVS